MIKLQLASREYRDNPWQKFGELRALGPVIKVKFPVFGQVWVATTFESVNQVLKDTDVFARDPKTSGRMNYLPFQWLLPRSLFSVVNNMLASDGEKHKRLRLLVDRAFAMRSVDQMEPQIAEIARMQLSYLQSKLDRTGSADLMHDFAKPFPLTVICELLGLPMEDRSKFMKWFAPISSASSIFDIFKIGLGIRRISRYLRDQFKSVQSEYRNGLMSDLVRVQSAGDKLSEDELLAMVFLLLVAGHETTVHLITNLMHILYQHKSIRNELTSNWRLADAAIDETLRYASPIQFGKPRYVINDLEFFGARLKRKDLVMPILACANYDPQRFEKPTQFDLHRKKNYHLTFGSGPHVCLGMKLAKAETRHAAMCLVNGLPDLKPDFDLDHPDWSKRIGMRGFKSFRVKLK